MIDHGHGRKKARVHQPSEVFFRTRIQDIRSNALDKL